MRYRVEPCDNHGTTHKERTWLVVDVMQARRGIADLDTRGAARLEAAELNAVWAIVRAIGDL